MVPVWWGSQWRLNLDNVGAMVTAKVVTLSLSLSLSLSAKILVIYKAMEADTINFMVMVKIMDFQGFSGDAEN